MPIPSPTPAETAAFRSLSKEGDLAAFLGVSVAALRYVLYSPSRRPYRSFFIRKASGGVRGISSPPPDVARFQRKVLACLTAIVQPKKPCHGFAIGRHVGTNAKVHVAPTLLLNLDLEDFFPSIHFGRIQGVFRSHPFNFSNTIASMLAQLCCDQRRLPQGAPTSPMLSNLVCRGLDIDLDRLARKHGCRYSRYADDISISTRAHAFSEAILAELPRGAGHSPTLGVELSALIAKHDFRINAAKTRVHFRTERQEVTGLVVNEKVNVRRKYVRSIRSALHDIKTKGLSDAQKRFEARYDQKARRGASPALADHLHGRLAFLQMIRGSDDPVFVKLALRAQRIAGLYESGVAVYGRSASEQYWYECLWIVIGLDAGGDEVSQGTAFTLEGVGVVSAAHVFHPDDPATTWKLISPVAPFSDYPITGIREDLDNDVALLSAAIPPGGCLRPATQELEAGDPIHLIGFPAWRTHADKLLVASGKVTQTKVVSAVRHVSTDAAVRDGNSGGPILSADGRVIAVALNDDTNTIHPNGGVAVSHFAYVAGLPEKPL